LPLDPESLKSRQFRRILLIKLSALGDVIHTIPVLNRLRRRYPAAQIDWLLTPALAEMLQGHPAISRVLLFEREKWSAPWSALASVGRLARELRAANYDLVVDMHGQFRTALLTLATGAPVRIGFDRPRAQVWGASARSMPAEAKRHAWKGAREGSWLAYTHHIAIPTLDVHAIDRYLSVSPMLGLDHGEPDFSFPIARAAEQRVERMLGGSGTRRLLTIAPGTVWETKHWRREGFAEVARHFLKKGFAVALIGAGRERETCREVAAAAPGVIDLAGETTLSDLAALIRRSTVCLTNDSGPMHLAVALDRPVVSVFGPTDEIWIGPYRRPDAVLRATLPCAPCYLRVLSRCPHDHACMSAISAPMVIERLEQSLAACSLARAQGVPAA
jgi:lipopolysaccharide heptosyltransferase I